MLKAKNLSYQVLLHNICLEFIPGYIYGILGPNGAGKTTFLKTLSGLWQPTSGEVLWKGENLLSRPRKEISQIISLVPQNPTPCFAFSVEDMVSMGRYAHQNKDMMIVEDALKKVDAWRLRHRKIGEISAGERQRVYIGRALATEAQVLLLDEPTANLDIRHQREIWSILRSLATQGHTIVVSLHDFSAAEQYCHEVAVLSQGRCAATGRYDAVMTSQLLTDVFGIQ